MKTIWSLVLLFCPFWLRWNSFLLPWEWKRARPRSGHERVIKISSRAEKGLLEKQRLERMKKQWLLFVLAERIALAPFYCSSKCKNNFVSISLARVRRILTLNFFSPLFHSRKSVSPWWRWNCLVLNPTKTSDWWGEARRIVFPAKVTD